MMHTIFHGVYGIKNIKTVKKNEDKLKKLDLECGHYINPDSVKKYKEFRDILYEIHNNYEERMIIYHHNPRLGDRGYYGMLTKEDVQWFVDHKCCWGGEQYRLDRYYQFMVDSPGGPYYMVLAVLKKVIYTEGYNPLFIWTFDNDHEPESWVQPSISEDPIIPKLLPKYGRISEKEEEFKDAYIVVRRERKQYD